MDGCYVPSLWIPRAATELVALLAGGILIFAVLIRLEALSGKTPDVGP